MFVVLRPRRRVTSWTLSSGSVYYNDFSFGYVSGVSVNGTALALGSSSSLSAGQYYYDNTLQRLYIRKTSGTPSGSDWIVVTFELFLSTHECYWYRNPVDDTSQEVYWRGNITSPPTVSRNASDIIFGYIPTSVTGLTCVNDPYYFQEIIHDSSFNNADVLVYHQAGSLSTANFQQIFGGFCGSYSFDDKQISFDLLDKGYRMNEKWNNGGGLNTFPVSYSGNLVDPARARTFIRSIYGQSILDATELIGVNLDYVDNSPGTSDNRDWGFQSSAIADPYLDITILATNTASDFDVSLADAKKLMVGDKVFGSIAGGYVCEITGIDLSTGNVTFDQPPYVPGSTFRVMGIYGVKLIQNGVAYSLLTNRDYEDYNFNTGFGCYGLRLSSTAEANVSASTIDPANGDYIIAQVRGANPSATVGGSPFYSGILPHMNPLHILYGILRNRLQIPEASIDTSTMQSLSTSLRLTGDFAPLLNISIPDILGDEPPTFGEAIAKVLTSCFLRMFINNEGKFTLSQIGEFTTADAAFTEDDLINIKYEYRYGESGGAKIFTRPFEAATGKAQAISIPYYPYTENEYDANNYLHNNEFFRDIETRLTPNTIDTTATTLDGIAEYGSTAIATTRYEQLVGERKCRVYCTIKSGAHGLDIGDFVTITRSRQPGFSYNTETTNSRNYVVIEITKSLGGVDLVLDDQKGVEDNTGDW
jgi:hypothetical protein